MFQTDSQINPSLGRTDYSAYAQGAVAGGQAIGQGIANLAQGIASGIEAYTKKKEAKKELETAISGFTTLADRNPKAAEQLGLTAELRKDPKAIASVVKSLGGPAAANSLLFQLAQQQQQFDLTQSAENRKTNVANDAYIFMETGKLPVGANGVLDPRYTAEVERTAYQMGMERDIAKAKSAVKPNQFNVAYGAFIRANPNPTPQQEKSFVDEYLASTKASSNTTIVNTPENKGETATEEFIGKAIGEQYISIGSSADAADKSALTLDRVKSLYEQGAYTGVGSGLVSGLGKFASTIGLMVPEQASQDQLEQILQEGALVRTRELFKGTGSLSNLEGSKGEQTVANLSRTPAGNIKILEWEARNAPVLRAADELKITLREKGVKPEKIVSEVRKYVKDNYIKLEDVASGKVFVKPTNVGRFQVIEVKTK